MPNGTCGWTDVSTGSFAWEKGSGSTGDSNTGPSYDHSYGNELGKHWSEDFHLKVTNKFSLIYK